jgi:hypothetical protein
MHCPVLVAAAASPWQHGGRCLGCCRGTPIWAVGTQQQQQRQAPMLALRTGSSTLNAGWS